MIKKTTDYLEAIVMDLLRETNKICKMSLSLEVANELNYKKEIKANVYAYDKERLIGYLNIFAPSKDAAEIQCVVHPDYRKRHVFTELLTEARRELEAFKIYELLLVCDEESSEGKAVLSRLGYRLNHSEYQMAYTPCESLESYPGVLEPVTEENVKRYVKGAKDVFGSRDFPYELIDNFLKSENRYLYLVKMGTKDIGIASYSLEGDKAVISGLGILKKHRGMGYAKGMLSALIKEIRSVCDAQVTLEVDSSNEEAFGLYTKYGFKIMNQINYYQ